MSKLLTLLAWAVLVLIGIPVLFAVALVAIGNSGKGRTWIEQATAHFSHDTVQLRGLTGRFPDRLRVRELSLQDPHGTWLQADGVVLDWSPSLLLARVVKVQSLTAGRINMSRRPQYSTGAARPPATRASVATFRLPLTVQIDRLELPRVQLAASVAGSAVALGLQGGGSFRSLQHAAVRLTARRLDQVPATYRAAVQLDPRRLRIALDVAEQANGPLANLVRLPGLGALALELQLDGPLDNLAVTLNARADGLRARAGGTLDLPDRSAVLDLSLQAPAMTPRPGLSWQSVSLLAHAHGAFTAPATSAQLEVSGLAASTVRLASLHADLRGEGQGLALQATLAGLELPAPLHDMLQASPLHLQGQARIEGLSGVALDFTLSDPLIDAQAHYELGSLRLGPRPPRNAGALMKSLLPFVARRPGVAANEGTLTATFPNLAPWAALARLQLEGRGTLQGSVDLAPAMRRVSIAAGLLISGGNPQITRLLGPRAALTAQLAFNDHSVHLVSSQLSAARLQANAQGIDNHGQLDVGWQLRLPDLAALSLPAAGQLTAQGRVQGTPPTIALLGSADAQFSTRGLPAQLHLTLGASGLPQRPVGRLELSGTLDRAPLALQAALEREGSGETALQIQRAEWKSSQLAGTLQVDGDLLSPQGELTLRVGHLSELDALLGEPLHGDLAGSIRLTGRDSANRAQLAVDAHDIGVSAQRLSLLQIRGEIQRPLRAPRMGLQLAATATLHGVGAQLAATVSGTLADLQLGMHASTGGGFETAADATLAAIWHEPRRELELTLLTAHYRQQSAHLLAPALLSFDNGIVIDQLSVAVPPAQLQLHGRLTPTLDLQASAHHLATAVLAVVMPQFRDFQPQGSGAAQISLHGTLEQPQGSFTLSASGLGSGSGAVRGLPTASLRVHAQLAAGSVELTVAADAGAHMRLRVNGRVPLTITQPMRLQLTGTMDLNIANAVLEARGERVLGEMRVQAEVNGTPQVPQTQGELTLTDGSLDDYSRGLSLTDIQATLQAEGTEVRLTHMSAKAGTGTLTASGSINLAAHGTPVQLTVSAHNAQPLKSDLLTANLDMGIGVTGTLLPQQLAATGILRINKATINIPNGLPANVPVLNVIKPGQNAQAPAPAIALISELNLTVNAPTGIFVRGRGLSAQMGGTLHVSGSSSNPNISGGFDLINGTLDMAGSTLTFSSGRLSFNGTGLRHRIDPTLDFSATSSSGGIIATLHVGGYADAPVITLSSTPPLPQDEILARLLFGESVAQLTTLQIAGIGAALVTLTGAGGGGFNPLNTVEHALGLNRLVISSASSTATAAPTGVTSAQSNNGATIEAGRYITNRIYVGAKQSTNGLTQAQVQVDLTHNLKIQTTLSTGGGTVQGATPENDPGSSVGITYQFQY